MKFARILLPALAAALLGSGCATSQPVRAFWWQESNPWELQPTAKVVAHGPYQLAYFGHSHLSAPDDEQLYWNDRLKEIVSERTGVPEERLDRDLLFYFYQSAKVGALPKKKETFTIRWDDAPGRLVILSRPFEDFNRELWQPVKKAYNIFEGDRRKKIRFMYFVDFTHANDENFLRVVVFLLNEKNRPIRKASGWLADNVAADVKAVPGTDTDVATYGWKYRTVRTPDGNRQMWQPATTPAGATGVFQVGALIVKMLNEMTDEELDALEDVSP